MNLGIRGKTALVTASSKGIGKAIAESLAEEGCKIAICSRTKEDLINTTAEIKAKYDIEPFWTVCDLNNRKDIEETYKSIVKHLGSIDILVNNCGGPIAGLFQQLGEQKWQAAYEQVLLSAIRFCNLVIPDMLVMEWGRIINVTSITVKQPIENLMLSNTFRTGLIGFSKSLSNEVAKYNVTVNNIAPGYTLTNRIYDLAVHSAKQKGISHEEVISEIAKEIPMKRLANPKEIASVVTFLASQQASYITGNTIQVDGGWTKGYF